MERRRNNEKSLVYFAITISIIIIMVMSLISYFFSKYRGGIGLDGLLSLGAGNDSNFYWSQIYNYFYNPHYELIETSIYVPIMANLVKLVGILDPLVIKIFNFIAYCLFLVLVTKEMFFISADVKNRFMPITITIVCICIYPSLLINVTSGIYRDIWIVLFMTIVTFNYLKLISNFSWFLFIKLALFIFILTMFRPYAGLWAVISVSFASLYLKIPSNKFRHLLIYLLIVFFVWYTFFKNIKIPIVNMSLIDVFNYRGDDDVSTLAGSDFFAPLNQPNLLLFIKNYLYSFFSNLMGPLLWQWKSLSTIFTGLVEGFPILSMLVLLVKNRKRLSSNEVIIIFFILIWIAMISFSNNNLGTAARLRMYAVIQLMVITGKAFAGRSEFKKNENIIYKK